VFKKEDKKDQEVQGGEALSTGMYDFKYMRSGKQANELPQDVVTSMFVTGRDGT
jgi:hypothetical protein